MSANKTKYFSVQTETIVAAPNMTEAVKIARNSRSRSVLGSDTHVERLPAAKARNIAETLG